MHLAGQHERRARPDAGYAMAVLLAGIAIMGIVWTLVVPVWKQAVQREKEAELIFRAGQYARAVALYQRKYANAFPPSVEVLLREKFLRKKVQGPGDQRRIPVSVAARAAGAARADDDHAVLPGPVPGTSPAATASGLTGAAGARPATVGTPGGDRRGRDRRSQHPRTGRADCRSIGGHRGGGEQELGGGPSRSSRIGGSTTSGS